MGEKIRVRKLKAKNRLYIDLTGVFNDYDFEVLRNKLGRALKTMDKPFGIIVNQRNLAPLKIHMKDKAEDIMLLTSGAGCKKVVRVVGNNVVIKMQHDRMQSNQHFLYDLSFTDSVKKAELILEKNGL